MAKSAALRLAAVLIFVYFFGAKTEIRLPSLYSAAGLPASKFSSEDGS